MRAYVMWLATILGACQGVAPKVLAPSDRVASEGLPAWLQHITALDMPGAPQTQLGFLSGHLVRAVTGRSLLNAMASPVEQQRRLACVSIALGWLASANPYFLVPKALEHPQDATEFARYDKFVRSAFIEVADLLSVGTPPHRQLPYSSDFLPWKLYAQFGVRCAYSGESSAQHPIALLEPGKFSEVVEALQSALPTKNAEPRVLSARLNRATSGDIGKYVVSRLVRRREQMLASLLGGESVRQSTRWPPHVRTPVHFEATSQHGPADVVDLRRVSLHHELSGFLTCGFASALGARDAETWARAREIMGLGQSATLVRDPMRLHWASMHAAEGLEDDFGLPIALPEALLDAGLLLSVGARLDADAAAEQKYAAFHSFVRSGQPRASRRPAGHTCRSGFVSARYLLVWSLSVRRGTP